MKIGCAIAWMRLKDAATATLFHRLFLIFPSMRISRILATLTLTLESREFFPHCKNRVSEFFHSSSDFIAVFDANSTHFPRSSKRRAKRARIESPFTNSRVEIMKLRRVKRGQHFFRRVPNFGTEIFRAILFHRSLHHHFIVSRGCLVLTLAGDTSD